MGLSLGVGDRVAVVQRWGGVGGWDKVLLLWGVLVCRHTICKQAPWDAGRHGPSPHAISHISLRHTLSHAHVPPLHRFHEMLDAMDELGLEPNATLHHFTHPTWFEDLGGFSNEVPGREGQASVVHGLAWDLCQRLWGPWIHGGVRVPARAWSSGRAARGAHGWAHKGTQACLTSSRMCMHTCACAWPAQENIPLFVEWSEFMFKEFGPRIKLWATFNEPSVCAAARCLEGRQGRGA